MTPIEKSFKKLADFNIEVTNALRRAEERIIEIENRLDAIEKQPKETKWSLK